MNKIEITRKHLKEAEAPIFGLSDGRGWFRFLDPSGRRRTKYVPEGELGDRPMEALRQKAYQATHPEEYRERSVPRSAWNAFWGGAPFR